MKKLFLRKSYKLPVLLACLTIAMFSCKQVELDSEIVLPEPDPNGPSLQVNTTEVTAYRTDNFNINLNVSDDMGLYLVKIEYKPWGILESVLLDGTVKEYSLSVNVEIPRTASYETHSFVASAVDFGLNERITNIEVNVVRNPDAIDEVFIYGDVILAGKLEGAGWRPAWAEKMTERADGVFELLVHNHKENGEFLFISDRGNEPLVYGKSGDKISKTSSDKFIIPGKGYYNILFDPFEMSYSVEGVELVDRGYENLWIIGDGLSEFEGKEWSLPDAIPMEKDADNPNLFMTIVTRTDSEGSATRLLDSQASWAGELGWDGKLDLSDFSNHSFRLQKNSPRGFVWIPENRGEKYAFIADLQIWKGVVVKVNDN